MPATRFDPPIGTNEERLGDKLWPGQWIDMNPYGSRYDVAGKWPAFHTGADLNRIGDLHAPVYAIAEGAILFAARMPEPSTWGNLIVIQHNLPDGKHVFSRYGHLDTMLVQAGRIVKRGEQIGTVGDAFGLFGPHLHFDISLTEKLRTSPGDWPGLNLTRLHTDYVDPKLFILKNRVVIAEPASNVFARRVTALTVCNIRSGASTSAAQVGQVIPGQQIAVVGTAINGYLQLSGQDWWVAAQYVR